MASVDVNSINLHNYIDEKVINRFWYMCFKKDNPEQCWSWLGALSKDGYTRLTIKGKSIEGHRISYVIHKGPIPKDLLVRHSCNNRKCTNPKHLILGTFLDNLIDRLESNGDFRKLLPNQVREIRRRCAELESFSSIAKDFDITPSTVNKIKHYLRHKGV